MERVPWDDAMWDFQMAQVDGEFQAEQIKKAQSK